MDHMRQDQMYTTPEVRRYVKGLVWVGMDHRDAIETPGTSGVVFERKHRLVSVWSATVLWF